MCHGEAVSDNALMATTDEHLHRPPAMKVRMQISPAASGKANGSKRATPQGGDVGAPGLPSAMPPVPLNTRRGPLVRRSSSRHRCRLSRRHNQIHARCSRKVSGEGSLNDVRRRRTGRSHDATRGKRLGGRAEMLRPTACVCSYVHECTTQQLRLQMRLREGTSRGTHLSHGRFALHGEQKPGESLIT